MKTIRTTIAGLLAALSLVLAGCAGKVAPDVDAPLLECHAALWDGGPTIGNTQLDGGPTLCPTGAEEGDPCKVPAFTVDPRAVPVYFAGKCAPISPPSS